MKTANSREHLLAELRMLERQTREEGGSEGQIEEIRAAMRFLQRGPNPWSAARLAKPAQTGGKAT